MVEDLRGGRTQQSVERAVAVRADDDEVRALLDRGTCPPRASRRGCISRPTMSGGPATAPGAEAPGPNGGGIESIGPMNGDGELTTCPPSRADARREKALAAPTASEPETSCKKVRRPFTNGRCARSVPRPCGSSIHVPSSPSSARWGIELAKVRSLQIGLLRSARGTLVRTSSDHSACDTAQSQRSCKSLNSNESRASAQALRRRADPASSA